jgi:hypothetical protein
MVGMMLALIGAVASVFLSTPLHALGFCLLGLGCFLIILKDN